MGHGQLTCTPRAPKCAECELSGGGGGDGDNEGPDPNDPMLQVPQELRQPGNEDALGQYMQEHAAEFEAYQQARQRRQERREALQAEAFAQQDRDKRVRELLA